MGSVGGGGGPRAHAPRPFVGQTRGRGKPAHYPGWWPPPLPRRAPPIGSRRIRLKAGGLKPRIVDLIWGQFVSLTLKLRARGRGSLSPPAERPYITVYRVYIYYIYTRTHITAHVVFIISRIITIIYPLRPFATGSFLFAHTTCANGRTSGKSASRKTAFVLQVCPRSVHVSPSRSALRRPLPRSSFSVPVTVWNGARTAAVSSPTDTPGKWKHPTVYPPHPRIAVVV